MWEKIKKYYNGLSKREKVVIHIVIVTVSISLFSLLNMKNNVKPEEIIIPSLISEEIIKGKNNIKQISIVQYSDTNSKLVIEYKDKNATKDNNVTNTANLKIFDKKRLFGVKDSNITSDKEYNNLPFYTISNLEKEIFIKENIPYRYILPEEPNLFVKLIKGLFTLLPAIIFAGIYFYTLKMQGLLGSRDKFKIIRPFQIKGDIEDLRGMDDIKRELSHIQNLYENRHLYSQYNIEKSFNVMFSGPAGVGKTKIAGYLAKHLGLPIIYASGSNLESGYVGGGSRTLNDLHKEAKKFEKCIVFIDEGQVLFMSRGKKSGNKYDDDTQNTFLSILDGINTESDSEIIWIVASNFDDDKMEMDEAMLRRFPLKLNFRLPNKAERKDLYEFFISKIEVSKIGEINYDYLADISANLSPAIISNIVQSASMIAIQDNILLTTNVVFKAFEKLTIGLTDRKTTENKEKERRIIAVHELGHFFAAFHNARMEAGEDYDAIKAKIQVLKISTESISKMNALGYVLNKQDDLHLKSKKELEHDIIELYGGMAAEELFYGAENVTVGAHNDIQKVTKILSMACSEMSFYKKSKINMNMFKVDNDEILKEIMENSELLYNRSIDIVAIYKEFIEKISNVLIEQYVISIDEMFDIIKEEKILEKI